MGPIPWGGGGVAGPGAYIEVINHLVMWVNLYNIYIYMIYLCITQPIRR